MTTTHLTFPTMLQDQIKSAQEVIADHAKKLASDPLETLGWINGTIEAAATIRVFNHIKRLFEVRATTAKGPLTADEIITFAKGQLHRCASLGMERSSAALAVEIQMETLRAWTKVIDAFTWEMTAS